MTTTITVAMNKGGVGKSTTAVTIAHKLALLGRQTVLADFGPQGSCSLLLGLDPAPGIATLMGDLTAQNFTNTACATGRDHLTLLPGNSQTRLIERMFLMEQTPLVNISNSLRDLTTSFDYLVIDTHPGYFMAELAIFMADVLVCVTTAEYVAIAEVESVLRTANSVGATPSKSVILPTMIRGNRNETKECIAELNENYPGILAHPIPDHEAVRQSSALGQTIWEYGPARRGPAAKVYEDFINNWIDSHGTPTSN